MIHAPKHWGLDHALRFTDFEWSVIEPLLPMKRRGVMPKKNQRVLNGVFWVLRTGAPWRDMPERYRPYTTAYNRFNRWRKAGIWDRPMDAIVKAHDGNVQMIDSSVVPHRLPRHWLWPAAMRVGLSPTERPRLYAAHAEIPLIAPSEIVEPLLSTFFQLLTHADVHAEGDRLSVRAG